MNRKERRAAQSGGQHKIAGPFSYPPLATGMTEQLFASAFQHYRAGQPLEAERLCRDALALDGTHFDSLHLAGIIALQAAQHAPAITLFARALTSNPRSPECHFNMAQALRALSRLDEAASHLRKAIGLQRDYAIAYRSLGDLLAQQERFDDAHAAYERALAIEPGAIESQYGLANLLLRQGRFAEAVTEYQRVLAARPDVAEVHSNLGVALAACGRSDEACLHYRRALSLKPQLLDVYGNLGRLLMRQGDSSEPLVLARRALAIAETDESRTFFVICVKCLQTCPADREMHNDLCNLITRALSEAWTRPAELSDLATMLFKSTGAGVVSVERAATAWPQRLNGKELWPENTFASVAGNRLLRSLLESAPVQDTALERFLTNARCILLERATSNDGECVTDASALDFFSALACQCFINEYVFALFDGELDQVYKLREAVLAALSAAAPISPLSLIALAAYFPLHSLPDADLLLERSWPDAVLRVIQQQVKEPLEEHRLHTAIAKLTPISDAVSRQVQSQYEEMPYPRWMKASAVGQPVTLAWYLRSQFPAAPIDFRAQDKGLDILIAGCGTGQHTLEAARRFAGANVLAIDLSLTSLAYAKRKTQELGIGNVEFAQADILELGSFSRRFDLIEASGVLHHLRDPSRGWRILLSLLRPKGVMHVALYSACARESVRNVRRFIAERGYRPAPADMREFRQEILALADDNPLKEVAKYSDFFTMSECRDLLFHVEEHQFTLPDIKSFLAENDLQFIGFDGDVVQRFRMRFPNEDAILDLDRWHEFEMEQPRSFVNMYQFWVQKSD